MVYQFITGPLLWLAFIVFFGGLLVRVVNYIRGLDWQLDRVAYRAHPGMAIKGALSSIIHWLIPFGSVGWRVKPVYTIIFFVFHIGLVVTPLFLEGHAVLLKERWGINWPTISMGLADTLTIGVMFATVCIAIRRIALPEVRIVTTFYDYFLLLLTVAPFATGFLTVYQAPNPWAIQDFWLYAHILSGELLLMAIPFTKLFHVVGYFLSRGQLGVDFGVKRAFKAKGGFAW
jgi:nitrate reductase gamma subunit